jgi:hypothetical protein
MTKDFSQLLLIHNGVSVQQNANQESLMMLKHLMYVWNYCGMQFERICSINHSVVTWFAHLHHLGFQPTLPNLGKHMWWW